MPVLCTDAPADGTVGASETEATTGVDCSKDDTDAVVSEGDTPTERYTELRGVFRDVSRHVSTEKCSTEL